MQYSEAISQLETLIEDRKAFIHDDEPDCVFKADAEACKIGMEAIVYRIMKKPIQKAVDGFTPDVASHLCCPSCGNPVINYLNKNINPPHCMMCGQALDWSDSTPCQR